MINNRQSLLAGFSSQLVMLSRGWFLKIPSSSSFLMCFLLCVLFFPLPSVFCIEKICGEFYSDKQARNFKGKFEIENYSSGDGFKLNDSLLCIYRFVARPNEKVRLNFDKFDIKSIAPDCVNEYIDIYIEATDTTLNNYVETNFLSRWCGWKKPHTLVSYHNVIVFAYHTDGVERGSSFAGTYEFIDSYPYDLGRKSSEACVYEFTSDKNDNGVIMSPTYPGTYPNNLNCVYKFIGKIDERVSIHFDEILIHYGADHCPYDALKVYDFQRIKPTALDYQAGGAGSGRAPKVGKKHLKASSAAAAMANSERHLIDAYCGRKLNFTVFSTYNMLEIEFEMSNSLGNDEYAEDENRILLRKGFKAHFKFSKFYADLAFITGTHVTGTNCDQRITSLTPSGFIYSPNFFKTYTINASCKYIFEGINDSYNSESVKLNFYFIDVKPTASNNLCSDESASHFLIYGADKNKAKFCTDRLSKETKELRSTGSELTIVFNSISYDQYTPSNFKASYMFFTEFRIEGTRVYPNRTCLFTYNSQSVIHGSVNSPRYPDAYPLNIKCEYVFDISSRYERILLTFREFKLWSPSGSNCNSSDDNLSVYQSSEDYPETDLVEFGGGGSSAVAHRDQPERPEWILLSRHCGNSLPTPFISDSNVKKIKLVFSSNDAFNAQGFNLFYNYVRIPECKFYFYTSENSSKNQIVITSNDMESTYFCDWYVKADSAEKSLLFTFKNLNLEDVRSSQFVIRVYDLMTSKGGFSSSSFSSSTSSSTMNNNNDEMSGAVAMRQTSNDDANSNAHSSDEMIGMQPLYEYKLDSSVKYFQADSSYVRLQLVIGRSMVMGEGKLVIDWITATKNKPCQSDEFLCNQTGYCIKSTYYCDKFSHCPIDFSDEPENCFITEAKQAFLFPPFIQITSFVVLVAVLVVFLALCILCRLKSVKKKSTANKVKKNGHHFNGPPIYYKYSPANSIDYLEAAITSV